MATTKLNMIAQAFMRIILDPVTETDGVIQPGKIITEVAEIETYISRAMMNLVSETWQAAAGNWMKLMKLYPDLIKIKPVNAVFQDGISFVEKTGENEILDLFYVLPSSSGTIKIDVWNPAKFTDIITGADPILIADVEHPAMMYLDGKIYLFPQNIAEISEFSFSLVYLRLPLNPLTGDILRSGGAYDSPFSEDNYSAIAERAAKLYFDENKALESTT